MSKPPVDQRTVSALVKSAYDMAASKGFHDDDDAVTVAHRLQLIAGEINEAFEELRDGHDVQDVYYSYTIELEGVKLKNLNADQVYALTGSTPESLGIIGKPEGFPVEIADTVIRLFDLAGVYGFDLELLILDKMQFNSTREKRHGRHF